MPQEAQIPTITNEVFDDTSTARVSPQSHCVLVFLTKKFDSLFTPIMSRNSFLAKVIAFDPEVKIVAMLDSINVLIKSSM